MKQWNETAQVYLAKVRENYRVVDTFNELLKLSY